VLWESLVKTVVRVWWYACFTLERRVVLKAEARPTDVGKGGAAGRLQKLWEWTLGCGGGGLGKDWGDMVMDWYTNQKVEDLSRGHR